jgi:ATP-dependent helicase/nuclease subunit A
MLRLLTTEDVWRAAQPLETGLPRQRFKYIFVDEYQDINPVQQAILDALSSGNNVFVVGDVKQASMPGGGPSPRSS